MKKEDIRIKQSKIELLSISLISILIIVAFLIRLLGLDEIKIIQILTNLILSNFWNLLVLIVLLTVSYYVKKKSLHNEIENMDNIKENENKCEK